MSDNKIIRQIQSLKQIQPREEWVAFTKNQILESPVYRERISLSTRMGFLLRPAFAFSAITAVVLSGAVIVFAQNSVPGDFAYPVKKIIENAQIQLCAEDERPEAELRLAGKRLGDLDKIASSNQVKNIAPAIEEFQASLDKVAKNLTNIKSDKETEKAIVMQVKKLEVDKQEIEKTLGTKIDTQQLEQAISPYYKVQVELLIKDLEERSLTEEEQALLQEAKDCYEAQDYSQALILLYANNK